MSLVVEDGTGLPNADSYVSVTDADAYHSLFGNAGWAAAAVETKETALRRAAQYIDTRYRFRGSPLKNVQALAWPRDAAAWPVPPVVKAACELGLRALSGPLYVDQTGPAVRSETVGPISVTYADDQRGGQVAYAGVDALLAQLTAGGGRNTLRIERAS